MQNRTCSRTVDQDVAVMLSPSKLAAERIYSTKRNTISFHAALQSGSPELAIAAFEKPAQDTAPLTLQQFEKPVQDTVPLAIQKPTFPTLDVENGGGDGVPGEAPLQHFSYPAFSMDNEMAR